MNYEVYTTLNGEAIVADADDESAPLARIEFVNDFHLLSEKQRLNIARDVMNLAHKYVTRNKLRRAREDAETLAAEIKANTPPVLTENEKAVICTIHQEENYRFINSEGNLARRMRDKGYLLALGDAKYKVTLYGESLYGEIPKYAS